jgi:hypothetical protein
LEALLDPSVIESLKTLGLPPDANLKEIKQAYKDLVTVWHPDRFANNPRLHDKASDKLKELNVAYNEVISYYQNMAFTDRTVHVQEPSQPQPPENTPFYPSDKHHKSSQNIRYTGLMIVLCIAAATFFLWGKDHPIKNDSSASLPKKIASSQAALVSSQTSHDVKSGQIAANQTPDNIVTSSQRKLPQPSVASSVKIEKEMNPLTISHLTDNKVNHQATDRTKPTQRKKIKKPSLVQSPVKISETPDLSSLTEDEQISIKSACSETKMNGASGYNTCLQKKLTLLTQGERSPDLSQLTLEEKSALEAVCSSAKFKDGPVSYNRCLKNHLSTLKNGEKKPDLSRLTHEEKSSIESVCSGARMEGPTPYTRCLNNHLAALFRGEKRPDLSRLNSDEKSSITSACGVAKMEGPASYNRCLNNQLKTINHH